MRTGDDVIRDRRAERKAEDARIAAKAAELWAGFTESEKTMTRFGMFPYEKMKAAEDAGMPKDNRLAVALMNLAEKNGGMRA